MFHTRNLKTLEELSIPERAYELGKKEALYWLKSAFTSAFILGGLFMWKVIL